MGWCSRGVITGFIPVFWQGNTCEVEESQGARARAVPRGIFGSLTIPGEEVAESKELRSKEPDRWGAQEWALVMGLACTSLLGLSGSPLKFGRSLPPLLFLLSV